MDRGQEQEWLKAQKIVVSEDLVVAAKRQLQFLSTVDRHRCLLHDGPVLQRAIFRYKNYWLPLLAKHTKSEISDGLLVVPLDCEWIWHCHRLNPLRYKADCEEFYGCILDNKNVVSTTEGASKAQAEEIWNTLYPEEPYVGGYEGIRYDLVAAVERQSPFFYQVSRPAMSDDVFLEEAAARYKGFLHMIKRNKERGIRRLCVPTYDIDLIWHSHQLHPVSYCKDLVEALGTVLEHDDTDSDRSKGQKLDVGFSGTTMQWEETFGNRYWRAGGMHRGPAPSPLRNRIIPCVASKTAVVPSSDSQIRLELSNPTVVEVLLEVVGVKNLRHNKGNLLVFLSKKTCDAFLDGKRKLCILSESRKKGVACFQCEPRGELVFELMSHTPSTLLGTTSISLQNMLPELSLEKWFELEPCCDSEPITMRIAISITTPTPGPHVLHMLQSRTKGWTCVVDGAGNEMIKIQMRYNLKKAVAEKREVVGIVGGCGETHVLATFSETGWSVMDFILQIQKKSKEDASIIFELTAGNRLVQLFPGRELKYESCQKQNNECDFVTAVEFSKEYPYGKEVALFNLKSGVLKIEEEWFVISGITLAFILGENAEMVGVVDVAKESVVKNVAFAGNMVRSGKCGNTVKSRSSSCGNTVKGGGCGHMVISGGCGGSCGSGCANIVMSGGCSASCGSDCGNMVMTGGGTSVESSGCRGGGSCGN